MLVALGTHGVREGSHQRSWSRILCAIDRVTVDSINRPSYSAFPVSMSFVVGLKVPFTKKVNCVSPFLALEFDNITYYV